MTASGMLMFSAEAIDARRVEVEASSSGLKRNFEHREARGSIILQYAFSVSLYRNIGDDSSYRVT